MRNLILKPIIFCIQLSLILMPISTKTYAGDDPYQYSQSDCPEHQTYDARLNRCLTSQEVVKVQAQTKQCMRLEDKAAQDQCYKARANDALADSGLKAGKENVVKTQGVGRAIIAGVTVGIGTLALFGLKPSQCSGASTSLTLLKTAAILNAANEVATFIWYRSKIHKIKKDFKHIVDDNEEESEEEPSQDQRNAEAVTAQSKAFEFLIQKEHLLEKVAKTKGTVYLTAAGLYAAAGIVAAIEAASTAVGNGSANFQCQPSNNNNNSKQMKGLKMALGLIPAAGAIKGLFSSYENKMIKPILQKGYMSYDDYFYVNEILAYNSNLSSPSLEDYKKEKESFKLISKENQIAFLNTMKKSLRIILNITAISSAVAQDDAQENNYSSTTMLDNVDIHGEKVEGGGGPQKKMGSIGSLAGTASMVLKKQDAAIEQNITKVTATLGYSPVRIAVSAVLGAGSAVLGANALKQAKRAKERRKYLEKTVAEFQSLSGQTFAQCSDKDRESATDKPTCYCFTADGQRNENRTKSVICQKFFNAFPAYDPTQYNNVNETVADTPKACVSRGGGIDPSCSCRTKKDKNSCLFIPPGINLPGGLMNAMKPTLNDTNSLLAGSMSGANLNSDGMEKRAMRLLKAKDKLLDKNKKLKGQVGKFENQLNRSLGSNPTLLANYSKSAPLAQEGNSLNSLKSSIAKQVKEKLEKADKTKANQLFASNPSSKGGDKAKGNNLDFDLDLGGDSSLNAGVTIQDGMGQEYEYNTSSEINQGSTTNIFELLSSRYQKSAMIRLFGEKKDQSLLEEANSTDINQ